MPRIQPKFAAHVKGVLAQIRSGEASATHCLLADSAGDIFLLLEQFHFETACSTQNQWVLQEGMSRHDRCPIRYKFVFCGFAASVGNSRVVGRQMQNRERSDRVALNRFYRC